MKTQFIELDPDVYEHLKAIAVRIHAERVQGDGALDPTVLLHEAWMKLQRSSSHFESRAHFVAVAARAMRQIVVDEARARAAVRHGGDRVRTTLARLDDGQPEMVDLLTVDAALTELESVDEQAAQVVLLRVFGGLTVPEVAEVLGISSRSVDRTWRFARALLSDLLE